MERSGAPSFHPSELALPTLADDRAVRFDDERRSASVDQRPILLLGSLRHDLSQAERSKLPLKSLTHDNPPASGSVVVDDEKNKEGQPDYPEVERETSALDVRALFGSAQSSTFFTEYPALEDVRETSRQSPRSDDVPDDLFLQPMLSRRQRLSPIPSTNASTDDLPLSSTDSRSSPDDVGALVDVPSFITIDEHRLASANIEGITLASPSSSPEIPFPMTPPSYSSTSPPQPSSSPDTGRHRSPFHLPRKTLFLRAGADILKGVNNLSGSPGVMGMQPC
ncbi:hypothetical protein HETIRDRAFT_100036 [Heterobasidion irregulare TC 32-1]|uniref:Uncharacterized protein n=1 Tax=Heterobasidion irregulare (strain TC 32-1) TaxID=747525 RepID=W4KQP7_HETIT|nr:uncharacterized protein HETIRDRAFT_100036 [Heterobasidion irregulare TC 32-1]ETW87725.1 hypothetical protein HETIRDRAFT_100036 [Heterobasidion irregulare TC 32-1]